MKGIYFTDTHVMGRNPGSRVDDYPAALMKKFLEMEQVIKKEQPDFVVHGGDFFHTPTVADSIKNRYLRVLRRMKRHTKRLFLVPGNHDLFGYSMTTIDQTAIGILASAGAVTLLTRDKSYTITDTKGIKVELHGREYDKDIDKDPATDYGINENTHADYNFLFSHGMLLEKPFHPDVRHTLTKDVVTTADLVLNGHYHPGMPLHEQNGTMFGNPGSTGRDEGSKASVARIPQYAVITANSKGFTVDYVEYQVAEEGKKVFDRSQIEQRKSHERYLEAFEQTIQDAITFEAYDPKDVLQQLSKKSAIEQSILDDTFDSIVNAEKAIGTIGIMGYIEKKKAIGIKSIELENFQSHKKTKVELNGKGLNALTGASDSGKSAVIRALRWVFYNEPKGTDFIRHGSSRATVTVTFTDGSSITRSRTNSSAGEYIVTDTTGKKTEFKGFGSNMPIDIANTHQMPKVELSAGLEKPLNFSYQLDGHFLLSESPATRAATIGRLTGVHIVDAAIKEKSREVRGLTTEVNAGEKRIEELDEKLKTFDDISEKKRQVDSARAILIGAEVLEQSIQELYELGELYNKETKVAIDVKDELKAYDQLDLAHSAIIQAELLMKEVKELSDLRKEVKTRKAEVSEITADLSDYDDLEKGLAVLNDATSLMDDIRELKTLNKTYNTADEDVRIVEQDLDAYKQLEQMPDLDKLQAEIQELRELQQLAVELKKLEQNEADLASDIQQVEEEIAGYQSSMEKLFAKAGNKCPTCLQSVTDVSHILNHVG